MATEKRLIDANALKIHRMHNAGANHPLDVAYRKDIDNAPTVEAVEVVHGRWGAFEVFPGAASLNGYPCSVCGNRVPSTLYNLNYCPNCGAKMDGDNDGTA